MVSTIKRSTVSQTKRVKSPMQNPQYTEEKEDKAMLHAKLDLTTKERVVLELMMLSPIFVVLTVLFPTRDFLLTLVIFHIILAACPVVFFRWRKTNINWRSLLRRQLGEKNRSFRQDILLFAVPTAAVFSLYIAFRWMFPNYDYHTLRLPALSTPSVALMLFIDFVIINPIVEEIFWRFFCDLLIGQGQTMAQKIDAAFHFGLYHWFVLYFVSQDIYLSTAALIGLSTVGYLFTLLKQKFGLITVMLLHLGVDLGAGLAIWDMEANFLPWDKIF